MLTTQIISTTEDTNKVKETDRQEIAGVCAEFYEILYSNINASVTTYEQVIAFNNAPPMLESDVRLSQTANGKAPGPDDIRIKSLIGTEGTTRFLHKIYDKKLSEQKIPKMWKIETIILFHQEVVNLKLATIGPSTTRRKPITRIRSF